MDVRRSLAVLITVFLLAMSSWASACDLSCSLAKFHSGCQTQGASSQEELTAETMPADMPMGQDMKTAQEHDYQVHLDTKLCMHEPCSLISTPASPPQADHSQLNSLHWIAISISSPVNLWIGFHWIRVGASPPKLPATPLHVTTLRI